MVREKATLGIVLLTMGLFGSGVSASPTLAIDSAAADEPIKVLATLPILKDLVQEVGRDRVTVTSLLSGVESEQTYSPKPTDILAIQDARMLVQIGLGLDTWVDALTKNADNPRLLIITTSIGVPVLKNQNMTDRPDDPPGMRDPHIWLDPENAKLMMRHITEGFIKIDPTHKKDYLRNQAQYIQDLDQTQQRLMVKLTPLRNKKIITHHAAWSYFARRFGFIIRGSIASQIETEPSAKRLSDLVQMIKTERIRVIVSEPQLDQKLPQILAQETGARVVVLTQIPGALPGTESYRSMIEYDVDQVVNALKD
ncbi:MAG TPA: metal ABC transporter substrate-binding protein [Nitrospiria bacterium]|nr:metal ABC transporter substrate-binding protein [Nitrospiria bacterium]